MLIALPGLLYRSKSRERWVPVLWKIIGVLLVVWLAFLVVGAIFKLLVPILVVGVLILGGVMLYRAVTDADKTPLP
ncbi:hypothetical protein DE4585_01295 [Mycobacteroides salmoniphilum]|uniref:Uncharacterized protein n=1 Tax=Mycobacteroides salmoniphilum TaxID=404941 RepID=A0A4R8SA21_9MYCO|nr:hypothetical protein [Mycobacteroides salmoniphilum]TDZ77025.1 hypothetical protein DE4586_02811 [Mycobacteroides salmoniphilum]TDZ85972.1 hypothetical protein DE4585_01295 [Mycobacteroides salmoniphilum]TDZ86728.1 hypothetical protein DE4587_02115 [Mycobacteroides salmoniphilum]TDZ90163.1 hypothetical protein CCUG60885_04809 [Mycobacteroides salmoniphilum]